MDEEKQNLSAGATIDGASEAYWVSIFEELFVSVRSVFMWVEKPKNIK